MKTTSLISIAAALFAAAGAFAKQPMPPQSALMRKEARQLLAGPIPSDMILRPEKGKIALLNSQQIIGSDKLLGRGRILSQILCSDIKIEKEEEKFSLQKCEEQMKRHSATIAIFVTDDPALPMSLVSLEGPWAMINASKLAEGNPDTAVLTRRFSAELNRVLRSLLVVGEGGRRVSPIMENIPMAPKTGKDLDALKNIAIPMEDGIAIHRNMITHGVREAKVIPYEDAVMEGWAPAPTNDVQKAIWDGVHKVPEKPLKIEFDPATQKGKVTK